MTSPSPGASNGIRQASARDIPEIIRIARAVWPVAYGSILSSQQMHYMLDRMYSAARLLDEMESQGVRFWVALDTATESICGFASLGPTEDPRMMKLHKLYVLPTAQREGWGRRLVALLLEEARQGGASRVRLAVNKQNLPAQRFYDRMGFHPVDSVKIDIGEGFFMDDFVLEHPLLPPDSRTSWPDAIGASPFRHPMGIRPGHFEQFVAPTSRGESLRCERARWLQEWPDRHLVVDQDATALLAAWEQCWYGAEARAGGTSSETMRDRCQKLGEATEFDWLLLDHDFRFRLGAVCFPSSWAPEEKSGRVVSDIHSPVPGLNESLGRSIGMFLDRMKESQPWARSNWGMCHGSEMNQHPARGLPRLNDESAASELHLRVEHQLFMKLVGVPGLLFCIRIEHVGLKEIQSRPEDCYRLRDLIATMPEDVARYKGIHGARAKILAWLAGEVV